MPDASDFLGEGATTTDKGVISDYPASLGESAMAGIERQIDTNPLAMGARMLRTFDEDFRARFMGESEKLVDQKTAQAEIASRGLDIKVPMGGMTRYELDTLQYLKQREVRQNTVAARADGALGVASGFAGALAGSFTDPINVASNFIPFVSEYRYARWLAQAGTSTLGRAAVRAGAGAIEGAAGAALLEPLVYAGATSLQLDYDSTDSFLNVTLGGVMGGGLHTIGGAVYDARVSRALRGLDQGIVGNTGIRDALAALPEMQQRELFQAAVAAAERGEVFDVEPSASRAVDAARAEAAARIETLRGEADAARNDAALSDEQRDAISAEVERQISEVRKASPTPQATATFTTAKGSVYQVHADGTTSRNKAYRPEHGFDEQGVQPTSDKTVYLSEDAASALATPQSNWRMFRHDDGTVSLISKNKDGAWGISPSARNVKVSEQPEAGLLPLELWEVDPAVAGKKGVAYRRVHFGNKIVDIKAAEPSGPPRDLGGLIKQSRADRTQEAFDRQFVDDAEATIAKEKARPKDKIEGVKQDEAEFRDVVEEYRSAGRVTADDDNNLKQADELAGWAERRAKAFEAAAGCMETS